MLIRWKSNN